jgi:hypothetical protein
MYKLIASIAVLLLAMPAMAAVTVEVVDEGSGVAAIEYTADASAELPRAFALDLSLVADTNDANLAPYDFNPDFYVAPGTFAYDDIAEEVTSWGDPLADVSPNSMTIEMGSLYATNDPCHPDPPATSGVLFRVKVQDSSGDGEVCIHLEENAARAGADSNGVVLEDLEYSPRVVNLVDGCLSIGAAECYPSNLTDYPQWLAAGSPIEWCHSSKGGLGDYQCYGDANFDMQFGIWRIYTNDLDRLADAWKSNVGDANWNPAADVAHDIQFGIWRVYTNDLDRVAEWWKAGDVALDALNTCGLEDPSPIP